MNRNREIPPFKSFKHGFTLIELLVVVAIIGVLAGIVLPSLNTGRDKAQDTQIKAQAHSIQAEAQIFYLDNGRTYDPSSGNSFCESSVVVASLQNIFPGYDPGDTGIQDGINCNVGAQFWVLSVPLATTNTYWCIDSNQNEREISATVSDAATSCPSS